MLTLGILAALHNSLKAKRFSRHQLNLLLNDISNNKAYNPTFFKLSESLANSGIERASPLIEGLIFAS